MTVIGQSSGGTSVFALLSSPFSVGLFHRAISMSGSPNISITLHDAEVRKDWVSHSALLWETSPKKTLGRGRHCRIVPA